MRSSIVLALAGVALGLGCTPTGPEPRDEESAAELEPESFAPPPGAWVVVDEGWGLFSAPSANAMVLEGAGPQSRLRVAEVVGIERGFIELRTIAGPVQEACAGRVGFVRDYELHFFVEPRALHPVLGRPKRFVFRDGARLELAAGVPVIEVGPEGRIRVGSTQLVVDLAEADVGRWWIPSELPSQEPSNDRLEPDLELRYGDHHFVGEWPPFRVSQQQQILSDGRLLTFENACGRFVLRAGPETEDAMDMPQRRSGTRIDPEQRARHAGILGKMAEPYPSGPIDFGDDWGDPWAGLTGCTAPPWTAPVGATLIWPDGSEAGRVLVQHDLPTSVEERDGRLCFHIDGPEVCIESAELEREGEPYCPPTPEPTPRVPQVRQAKAQVSAGLDRDIVRRIVRSHISEIRHCYSVALDKHPTLRGRVVIAFEIGPTGKVSRSEVHETSAPLADDRLGPCIAKAIKRWTFPRPQGAETVDVVYPFMLSPD